MMSLEMDNELERELEIARRIQASFFPQEIPRFPGWEIATRFQPARQVAGDFYDLFPLVQNRRLGLVIGDVCDKGVGAALFMALFRTLIRAFAQQHYTLRWMDALDEDGPARRTSNGRPVLPSTGTSALKNAIELTNNYIADTHGGSHMFATVFLGVLDPSNGLLLYVNGGHEFPILVSSAGVKRQLKPTGPLVGVFPGAQFEIQSADLERGETLVAFTDGVTEAQNSVGEFFGRERLYALLTIINDILDFSKIEARRMELESQPFDLRECVESAMDLLTASATEKGLNLGYVVDKDVPVAIVGDVTRLRQVLVNLLSNAVKFTEEGEVVVTVTVEEDIQRVGDTEAGTTSS